MVSTPSFSILPSVFLALSARAFSWDLVAMRSLLYSSSLSCSPFLAGFGAFFALASGFLAAPSVFLTAPSRGFFGPLSVGSLSGDSSSEEALAAGGAPLAPPSGFGVSGSTVMLTKFGSQKDGLIDVRSRPISAEALPELGDVAPELLSFGPLGPQRKRKC
jgi:hypothetical protein